MAQLDIVMEECRRTIYNNIRCRTIVDAYFDDSDIFQKLNQTFEGHVVNTIIFSLRDLIILGIARLWDRRKDAENFVKASRLLKDKEIKNKITQGDNGVMRVSKISAYIEHVNIVSASKMLKQLFAVRAEGLAHPVRESAIRRKHSLDGSISYDDLCDMIDADCKTYNELDYIINYSETGFRCYYDKAKSHAARFWALQPYFQ